MKRLFTIFTAFLVTGQLLSAQNFITGDSTSFLPDCTVEYARYDTLSLPLDIYMPKDAADNASHRCVIFLYGGGFLHNNLRATNYMQFCRKLADDANIVTIAADYRLGLKGVKMKGVLSMVKPLENAVQMASEDLFKALKYILDHAEELKINPKQIILCGSSAGAITSLQSDYELCNRTAMTSAIPQDFRFAGIISFAGAVFSRKGKCKYTVHAPAPTFMLHGIDDRLVTYDKVAFFNTRLSGSNDLVKQFKKYGYSYWILRFVDEGHGVAARQMDNYGDVLWFIDNIVAHPDKYQIDETRHDRTHKRSKWDKADPGALYK